MKIPIPSLLGYAQLLYKQEPSTALCNENKILRLCTWVRRALILRLELRKKAQRSLIEFLTFQNENKMMD